MKTIGIVTMLAETGNFLKAQLDKLFSDMIKVNLYILSEIDERQKLTEEDFIVFPGIDAQEGSREKLEFQCDAIIANRSVNYDLLDEVFRIPEGEEVYVLNDFKSATLQSIKYLQELGINHIHYIPLHMGSQEAEEGKTLITFGEYNYLPPNPKKIIDLGVRTLDISTIVEILLRLGFSNEIIGKFTTKYVRDIISLTNEINSLNNHNEYIKNKLATLIQTVSEGILTIDNENKISVINEAAEKILECRGKDFVGRNLSELEKSLSLKFSSIDMEYGENSGILDYFGKKLVINESRIVHNQSNIEKVIAIREVTEIQKLEQKLRMKISSKRYEARYTFGDIKGSSEIINTKKEMARKIARFDSPVYIYGESGTGKELFAQAIHLASPRKNGPFVAVNFAAMSESLLESELFGYAEGAFTGAKKGGMPGVFEQAHGGTLFLDEIGDSPLRFQIKLLRVLQEKQVRRIGDDKNIPVDVRVIVATNKKISDLVEEGKFREDLYYRINVLPLSLPPLRERKEDIICLAQTFYKEMTRNDEEMVDFDLFLRDVKDVIVDYDFPGNARQLRNIIEYLICTAEDGIASSEAISQEFIKNGDIRGFATDKEDEEIRCLKTIERRMRRGLSSGRRSLAEETGYSEEKINKIVSRLAEKEEVSVSRGRKGILLTAAGKKRI